MGKKTPPCNLYPSWTQARFKSFLKSALRSASSKWPPKFEALKLARRKSQLDDKRSKWEYICSSCNKWYKSKDVELNHKEPVGGFGEDFNKWPEDLGRIAERMFCDVNGYEVLCKKCHNKETQKQRTALVGRKK